MFNGYREGNGLLWRVEPLCMILNTEYGVCISTSGYYDFKQRAPSARHLRDEHLKERIQEIYSMNYSCYGVRKMWHQLLKDDCIVARCTVERLMREQGLRSAVRGKVKRTTIAGDKAVCTADLVKHNFNADTPNRLWVADFTYVSTSEGWCYSAFVTDVFARRILGWICAAQMNKKMVADTFRMALFTRARDGHDDLKDLIHHNDKGSQYTADDFTELLALHGVRVSIGSIGDAYDNALAETIIGAYKTELIKSKGPWKSLDHLRLETAKWVNWYNTKRISRHNNWNTPLETEEIWYNNGVDTRKEVNLGESLTIH
jgi:putative transposase